MTRWQWVARSLLYHRRIHSAVALGVAAATAVLTGALLVGDSVRMSLRDLTLQRLGEIESVLASDRFFREELATEIQADAAFQQHYRHLARAILFSQATMEQRREEATSRASSVLVLGCDASFWEMDTAGIRPQRLPDDGEIVLNEALAGELQVQVGDEVTLRLPKSNQVPADSPLASRNDRIGSLPRLRVTDIIPTRGLGRFSLQAAQSLPLNAFVSIRQLQRGLDQPGKVNAILVGGNRTGSETGVDVLAQALHPLLADFGVTVQPIVQTYRPADSPPLTAFEYFTVTTDRMIFSPRMSAALERVLKPLGGQPVLTYLANSISQPDNDARDAQGRPLEVPYSMIAAIDVTEHFPLPDRYGQPIEPLRDDEIVLNAWAADNLGVASGDRIRITYFEPETTHGAAVERSAEFTLRAIAALTPPARPFERNRPAVFDQRPTLANDPHLTPEVAGVTDQETIENWDAPFPFDYQRMRTVDDDYWKNYRTTPKAFVSLATGQKLWGSRFGAATSYRIPPAQGRTLDQIQQAMNAELAEDAANLGLDWIPIRQRQLAASRGTTPFDVLFLSLSFFVIAAALLLVALLFRLGIEQRATEIGTLLAVGFTQRRVERLFVTEGSGVATVGAILGIGVGIGYARLMLAGLSTWWLGAISVPFLEYHWQARSIVIGWGLGIVMSVATIAWSVRQTRRVSVRRLLSGQAVDAGAVGESGRLAAAGGSGGTVGKWSSRVIGRVPLVVPLLLAVLLSGLATQLGGMAQAGTFVASGAGLLLVLLLGVSRRLHRDSRAASRPAWERSWLLWSLAERSAARNPGRSVTTIGLMATATFLIVAMSSFRLAPTERGAGGFELIGRSSEPLYEDLNLEATRKELFGSRASEFVGSTVLGLRLRPGDDASCQNLYQAAQPRVIGVTPQVVQHFESQRAVSFVWAAAAAESPAERGNPWRLLNRDAADSDSPVPVVIDKNTAMFSLQLYRGIGEEFTFEYDGRPIQFRVAGLLENSVLQGSLLIGEDDFRRQFPGISGYQYFLIAAPPETAPRVAALLEDRFSDQGLDVVPAHDVLEQLLAVQNSYLSTFQSLGALGLLLGAFGLVAVQLRNVLERKSELALLRAVGYRRRRLAQVVLLENIALLVAGLLTGFTAAMLAVIPHKLLGDAAVSWLLLRDLAIMLAVVMLAGVISSLLAARTVLRLPLLAALRGE